MALTLTVTDAGRAALRNAQGDGTNAVRIASVGVTASSFVSGAPLPAEIKRIATIAGGATSPDTIHVTVSDTGTDVYSVRGFGFYLVDGTLFASYGQANVIVEKSDQATMMLAVDVKFAAIDATQVTFGDSNFSNPAATTDTLGVVRLAADAEAIAGADAQKALTAKNLLAALNYRFGAGAPSDFVKTLLTKASVLAFCTALGIRGAAQYDTGSGNGLDADLLDGKDGSFYQQWANLTGVPSTFAPAPHKHSADDITSGTLPVARGGTGLATVPSGSYLVGNGTGVLQTKAPSDVLTDIGAAAKQHSHPISDIVGLQSALDAKTTPAAVAAQISAAVGALVNGAPGALDTLKELADAMGDDPNFAATVTNALAQKLNLSGGTLTGGLIVPSFYVASGTGEADLFMRYNGSVSRQVYFSNNASGFAINYTDANGNYVGNGFLMDGTTGAATINKLTTTVHVAQNGQASNSASDSLQVCSLGWLGWSQHPRMSSGAYNPLVQTNDGAIIYSRAGAGGYGFTIAPWSSSMSGLHLDGNGAATFATSGLISTVTVTDTGTNGANLNLRGNGSTTPSKTIRVCNGNLQFVNSAYSGVVTYMDDAGNWWMDGSINAVGGFQLSDKSTKKNIKRRAVERGFALRIARLFSEWDRLSDGVHDVGLIAQSVKRFAARYVQQGKKLKGQRRGLLAIDKAGIALESSMDNALHLHEHDKQLAALVKRIKRLEKAA